MKVIEKIVVGCALAAAVALATACPPNSLLTDVQQKVQDSIKGDQSQKVATPVLSPSPGAYSSDLAGAGGVTITDSTSGAVIHYTIKAGTQGTPPGGPAGTEYTGSLSLTGNHTVWTIEAIATKEGMKDSEVVAGTYRIDYPQLPAPVFSPSPNSYSHDLSQANAISITDADGGSAIYCTVTAGSQGTAPSMLPGELYTGPIELTGDNTTWTIVAVAVKSAMSDSQPSTGTYSINYNKVSAPVFAPAQGSFTKPTTVAITSDAGSTIYYTHTTDESFPPTPSAGTNDGSGPSPLLVTVSGDGSAWKINAIAAQAGKADSNVQTSGLYSMDLAVPANVSVGSQTESSLSVSWGGVPEATGYNVYRDTSQSGQFSTAVASDLPDAATSCPDSGLSPGTIYWYKVQAKYVGGPNLLSRSPAVSGLTTPATPEGLTVSSLTSSSPSLAVSWNASPSATSYKLFRAAAADGPWTNQVNGSSPTSTSFTDSGLATSTTYYYKVQAVNASGSGLLTSSAVSGTTLARAAAPTFTPGAGTYVGSQSVTISSTTTGASIRYTIDGTTPTSSSGLPYSSAVTVSVGLTLKAMAYKSGMADSTVSTAAYVISPPAVPTGLTAGSPTDATIAVSWSASTGATSYQVYRDTSTGGSFSAQAYSGSALSFTDTGLAPNTTYYYKARATNAAGSSGLTSSPASSLTRPACPTGLSVTTQANSLYVTWNAVAGNGSVTYQVQRDTSTNGSFSTQKYNGLDPSFTDTGLVSSQIYYYEVKATNSSGSSLLSAAAWGTSSGIISTVAGNGTEGSAGDGGAATAASLYRPIAVAVDASGNIYIADRSAHKVRKVTSSTGIISTIAGMGSGGFGGDGGAATAAYLYYPCGVALDSSGNVYIADMYNHCIRKVTVSTGIISTVAGQGMSSGYSGDGGAATAARLKYPSGVAFDSSGNMYIGDSNNHCIRKVTTGGIISTIAGTGTAGYNGDGIAATAAQLNYPVCAAVDSAGNIYIVDSSNRRIRKVTSGTISTVAGTGTSGFAGDGGAATSANLSTPYSVFVDSAGNLYFADKGNNRIRKVNADGIIYTVAGSNGMGYAGDGGAATLASLNSPGFAVVASGDIIIADEFNVRIRKVH